LIKNTKSPLKGGNQTNIKYKKKNLVDKSNRELSGLAQKLSSLWPCTEAFESLALGGSADSVEK
jgi:hypothetical protein